MDLSTLTWTCPQCRSTRPDAAISVRQVTTDIGGITITKNIKYCNDRPECIDKAFSKEARL